MVSRSDTKKKRQEEKSLKEFLTRLEIDRHTWHLSYNQLCCLMVNSLVKLINYIIAIVL